jgi:hypothetical protein
MPAQTCNNNNKKRKENAAWLLITERNKAQEIE